MDNECGWLFFKPGINVGRHTEIGLAHHLSFSVVFLADECDSGGGAPGRGGGEEHGAAPAGGADSGAAARG